MASHTSIEKQSVAQFAERAYLDYAMYVVLDRALPSLADGLKPVQRRIVYAMSELGLKATAKYKKSARTVGDVLGKFHPHGDLACYEAMVLMAQPFSYRYPLIDGQGNWGSSDDPKSFAAMRYTEARLSAYAQTLLSELNADTVDWVPNFDATLNEPSLLPARLPNILLNGATGIAVGMTTDIVPHNLHEVVDACICLLKNPQATLEEVLEHLPGPDFPCQSDITTPAEQIKAMYRDGVGTITSRATYTVHDDEITIHGLPYQVPAMKVIAQIAKQIQAKKCPMLVDVRDDSNHEHPTRLVLIMRSKRVDAQTLMQHLFATTDCERTHRVNFNVVGLDRRPQVMGLVPLLSEWLTYRLSVVTKRLNARLAQLELRRHILDGLLIAYLNIDAVIAIIREHDTPKPVLMTTFGLSQQQAEAVLELKLRYLAKLEEVKIRGESDALGEEIRAIKSILASDQKLRSLVCDELQHDAERYGDARCCQLIERPAAVLWQEPIVSEPVSVIVSRKGWIRCAKGHDFDVRSLNYKGDDAWMATVEGLSNQAIIVFDQTGRSYTLKSDQLPSARSLGEPVTKWLDLTPGAQLVYIRMAQTDRFWFMLADNGYGFLTNPSDLVSKNRRGKAVVNLESGARLLPITTVLAEDQWLAMVSSSGRLLVFDRNECPILSKGKGNKCMALKIQDGTQERVVAVAALPAHSGLIVQSGKRQLTLSAKQIESFQATRGRRGTQLPRGFWRVQSLTTTVDRSETSNQE